MSELVQFAERVLDWRACVVSTGILTVSHMIQLSRSTCILVYYFIIFLFWVFRSPVSIFALGTMQHSSVGMGTCS